MIQSVVPRLGLKGPCELDSLSGPAVNLKQVWESQAEETRDMEQR